MRTRIVALLGTVSLLLGGCSGDPGAAGAAGTPGTAGGAGAAGTEGAAGTAGGAGATGATGAAGAAGATGTFDGSIPSVNASGVTTGLHVNVKAGDVAVKAGSPITVRFTLTDDMGFPVDINGKYSVNTAISARFSLSYFTKDAAGNVLPLKTYTATSGNSTPTVYNPTNYTPASGAKYGTLTENGSGAGDYTYTFPQAATADTASAGGVKGVNYDAAHMGDTHVVWVQISRQTDLQYTSNGNTYYTANYPFYYVPNGGTPLKREIAAQANCDTCHSGFRPETTTSAAFHSGGRTDPAFCNVCHSPDRASNPLADSASAFHRIHYGEHIIPANQFHAMGVTYPQDIRNCDQCHKGAAQGAQAQLHPTRAACGSCHDQVTFAQSALTTCTHPPAVDGNGIHVPCKHTGSTQTDDAGCAGASCHGGATPALADAKIRSYHEAIVSPNANEGLAKATKEAPPRACTVKADCTNAAFPDCTPLTVGAVNGVCANVAAGAGDTHSWGSYVAAAGFVPPGTTAISYEVKKVTLDASLHPSITFKFKKTIAGVTTDVVFADQPAAAGNVDGMIAGFVGSPSVYFAWAEALDGIAKPADFNKSASGYLRNIWNKSIPATEATWTVGTAADAGYITVVLTNKVVPATAVLYTGGLGYSYGTSTPPLVQTDVAAYPFDNTTWQGGISVPAQNVWKTGTDAADKAFTARRPIVDNAKCKNCHGMLGVAPTFHAGQRNDGPTCSFCHTPTRTSSAWSAGSRSFIHAIHAGRKRATAFNWHATAPGENYGDVEFPSPLNECKVCHLPNTYDYTASASLSAVPNVNYTLVANSTYDRSAATNPTGYFSIYPGTELKDNVNYGATPADNLLTSPITTVCVSCHDSATAKGHMTANGGSFYTNRTTALATPEQCMLCHGPGRVAAIGSVHQQ